MNTFLENPVPIWAVGAVLATFAGLVFLTRRNLPSLFALLGVVLLTLLLVLVERVVVTEREQVESAVGRLATAVEANDLPAVLALLDPASIKPRSDAQTLMPRLRIAKAHVAGTLAVEVDTMTNPHSATSRFRALLEAVDIRSGMKFVYFDEVEIVWHLQGDRWLVTDYTAKLRGQPVDAAKRVGGLQTPSLP